MPMIHIPAWSEDGAVNGAWNDWEILLRNRDDPYRGVCMRLAMTENVHVLATAKAGLLVPAWYAPFTPTSSEGSVMANNGYRYHYLAVADTHHVTWTIDADDAPDGCDTIIVHYMQVIGGGTADLQTNRNGAGWVTEETIDTDGAAEDRAACTTVTVDALTPGDDQVRLLSKTGATRIEAIILARSGTKAPMTGGRIILGDETELRMPGSSMEFAIQIAPAGGSLEWCGGVAHQTDCPQDIVQEFVSVDGGVEEAPTVGFTQGGSLYIRRISYASHPAPAVLAGINEWYRIYDDRVLYNYTFSTSEITDTGNRYLAMLPAAHEANTLILNDGTWHDLSDETGGLSLSTSTRHVRVLCDTFGDYIDYKLNAISDPVTSCYMLCDGSYRKVYWRTSLSAEDVPSGTTWSATVEWSVGRTLPYAPRLAWDLGGKRPKDLFHG